MNQALQVGLASLLLTSSTAFALNPVQGWYAGVFLGVSKAKTLDFTLNTPVTSPNLIIPANVTGNLTYSILGGLGGELGYRCNQFRLEGEILYNNNPFNTLTLGDLVIKSPSSSTTFRLDGSTTTGAGFLNGFYDLYTPNEDGWAQTVPYVGVGVGYAYVNNNLKFYFNDAQIPNGSINQTNHSLAGQAIAGFSYFMDDFTTIGLDVRYIRSKTAANPIGPFGDNVFTSRLEVYGVNLVFNGAFDYG